MRQPFKPIQRNKKRRNTLSSGADTKVLRRLNQIKGKPLPALAMALALIRGRLLGRGEPADLVKDATLVAFQGACLLKSSQGYSSDMRVTGPPWGGGWPGGPDGVGKSGKAAGLFGLSLQLLLCACRAGGART